MAEFVAGQILRAADLNGQVSPDDWTALTLESSWAAYGVGYNTPGYRIQGAEVSLRGLVKADLPADTPTKRIVAYLPDGFRPPAKELIVTWGFQTIDGAVRLDIAPDGSIEVLRVSDGMDIDGTYPYVSLDNIRFWTT